MGLKLFYFCFSRAHIWNKTQNLWQNFFYFTHKHCIMRETIKKLLRNYGTGYQTVWETRPSAETPSDVHWRRFCFQLTCVHSALELSGQCTLQIYLLIYLLIHSQSEVTLQLHQQSCSCVFTFIILVLCLLILNRTVTAAACTGAEMSWVQTVLGANFCLYTNCPTGLPIWF